MVTPLECLADSIMEYEGWHVGSRSWRNRNPGNLRYGPNRLGSDGQGYAVYDSLITGYKDLLADLKAKITGQSKHGLKPDSTLLNLFDVYAPRSDRNQPNKYAEFVAGRLTVGLQRSFTVNSTLGELWPDPGAGGSGVKG